jgi:thioredoxin reductase (NADPH)
MYDMIIIGAGPAGISMATEARAAGIAAEKVLILEKAAEHSFSLKKFYPDNKLVTANYKGFEAVCTGVMCIVDSSKHETITYLDKTISDNGIRVRYQETVHRIHKAADAQKFTVWTDRGEYDATVVVIAIGILGKPNKPEYRIPPSLRSRILYDMTTTDVSGSDVLVVGGGDSASEYCQYLVQKGNRVTLSYRRHEFTRMNEINRQSILALGERGQVEIVYGSNVEGVRDVAGKPEVRFREDGLGPRAFDYIVYTLGGTTPKNFLKSIGIEFDGEDPYVREGYETNVPGLFLIGDLTAGTKGGSIIWAFNSANTAMKLICRQYLKCASVAGSPVPVLPAS